MFKNVANQKLAVYAHDTFSDSPKTGDAANITMQISKDGGACAASNDVNPTELDATDAPGIYIFDLTQAETNADMIIFYAKSSTAGVSIAPVINFTNPANFTAFAIDSNGRVVLASNGLDNIADNEPSAPPSGWKQKLDWAIRRFFNKQQLDSSAGTLKVFKDNSTDVMTTQNVNVEGTTKTVDKAS